MEEKAIEPTLRCGLLAGLDEDDISWLMASSVLGPELREHLETCDECQSKIMESIAK
jgi:hypothetical protein